MFKTLSVPVLLIAFGAISNEAAAHPYPRMMNRNNVGLGLGAGLQVPTAANPFKPSEAWGFYTDIPLLETFHVSPSTLVYRLTPKDGGASKSATDISMNFKFIVPIEKFDIMAGVTAGLTSTDELKPHVGVIGGTSFNLVSNLDLFVHANYRYILNSENEVHDFQLVMGPQFKFSR